MKPLETSPRISTIVGATLKDYDQERMESSASALLDFYKHRHLRFNIALMGDRSSGKTSLIRKILQVNIELFN
jgi:GTPase SAR1 family protein